MKRRFSTTSFGKHLLEVEEVQPSTSKRLKVEEEEQTDDGQKQASSSSESSSSLQLQSAEEASSSSSPSSSAVPEGSQWITSEGQASLQKVQSEGPV